MNLMAWAFFTVLFSIVASADSLAYRYAKEIVRQNVGLTSAELEFAEWQQSVSGGYLLRFAFDVDGDGVEEQFLASSFNADRLVCSWSVYSGASGKLWGKGALFRPDGFWWNSTSREMLDYLRFGADGGAVNISVFGENDFITRSEPAAFEEVTSGLEGKYVSRQGFQWIKPKVTISLLADVVVDADSGWRSLILDDAGNNYDLPNGRLLLTEDLPRMKSLRDFTPQVAFAALEKSKYRSDPPAPDAPTSTLLPMATPQPHLITSKSHSSNEKSTSVAVEIIAIIAATMLLWLLCKRRS